MLFYLFHTWSLIVLTVYFWRSCRCMLNTADGPTDAVEDYLCDPEEMPLGTRESRLPCPEDCVLSDWSPWTRCDLVRVSLIYRDWSSCTNDFNQVSLVIAIKFLTLTKFSQALNYPNYAIHMNCIALYSVCVNSHLICFCFGEETDFLSLWPHLDDAKRVIILSWAHVTSLRAKTHEASMVP